MLIDTHCHLNDSSFVGRLDDVLSRSKKAGVDKFIVPSYDFDSLEKTKEIASRFNGRIYPAYGLHPWFITEQSDFEKIFSYISLPETVAVGEIGLDFSPGMPPHDLQTEVFKKQLEFARRLQLPVNLHCRKAHEQMYLILRDFAGQAGGVMHSFSGGSELAKKFVDMGYYISFSGTLTRQNSRRYHETARTVPLENILLETDAPSIATETTPAPQVEPANIVEMAQKIAEIKQVEFETVCKVTTKNAMKLFNIRATDE